MGNEISREQELFSCACKNAELGISGIDRLLAKTEDNELRRVLLDQRKEYSDVFQKAQDGIMQSGGNPKSAVLFKKHMIGASAQIKMLFDDSSEKMADMMIKGSQLGIDEMSERLKDYTGSDQQAKAIAQKLIDTEKNNISEMEKFM